MPGVYDGKPDCLSSPRKCLVCVAKRVGTGAGNVRIVFEEHGFPRELLGSEDTRRAVLDGSIVPDTELTVYKEGAAPAVLRAADVDELRPLLGLPDRGAEMEVVPAPIRAPDPAQSPAASEPATIKPRRPPARLDLGVELEQAAPAFQPVPAARSRPVTPATTTPPPSDRQWQGPSGPGAGGPALPLVPFAKYAVFDGRASRAEFWQFTGLLFVAALIASNVSPVALGLLMLASFLPSLAVTVRRLHDANITGWAALIGIVPYVGWLILIVLLLLAGTKGANRFGAVPRGAPTT